MCVWTLCTSCPLLSLIWAVLKRSCVPQGRKDLLTHGLADCLRHHSFSLRDNIFIRIAYAWLTPATFCTPPQRQLTRSTFLQARQRFSDKHTELVLGRRCRCGWGRRSGDPPHCFVDAALIGRKAFLLEASWGTLGWAGFAYAPLTRSLRAAYADFSAHAGMTYFLFSCHHVCFLWSSTVPPCKTITNNQPQ